MLIQETRLVPTLTKSFSSSSQTKIIKTPNLSSIPEDTTIPIPKQTLSEEAHSRRVLASFQITNSTRAARKKQIQQRIENQENAKTSKPKGKAVAPSASPLGALSEADE